MAKNSSLLSGDNKEKTVEIGSFRIEGHLLKWEDVVIQISNVSLVTSADQSPPPLKNLALCALLCLAGLFIMSVDAGLLTVIGLAVIVAGAYGCYLWYQAWTKSKGQKFLHIHLNSGYTYSILFEKEAFMREVLQVFANIFEAGSEAKANYIIDYKFPNLRYYRNFRIRCSFVDGLVFSG